jgi:hypothetical protein
MGTHWEPGGGDIGLGYSGGRVPVTGKNSFFELWLNRVEPDPIWKQTPLGIF